MTISDDTAFAQHLRLLRERAGNPARRAMAQVTGLSHTLIGGALTGQRLPSWEAAVTIITALQGDPEDFRLLWEAAERGEVLTLADQAVGELREVRLRLQAIDKRIGTCLAILNEELLIAEETPPGFPPLGEYRIGVDYGTATVWHTAADCGMHAAPAGGVPDFLAWIVSHHREAHNGE